MNWHVKFTEESNAIEGIDRKPTAEEITEAERFLELPSISIADLEKFVSVYQPNAALRVHPHMNVRVGDHIAPRGGPQIARNLQDILDLANRNAETPYEIHQNYETLHPFIDGNGRSGRILFAWQMEQIGNHSLHVRSFLQEWYYQSLAACR